MTTVADGQTDDVSAVLAGADDMDDLFDDRGGVRSSASKTLALLRIVAHVQGGTFGVTEVALKIGAPKSTTHRLLQTLEEHGFIARVGSRYRVGDRFFELNEAARWSEHGELRDAAYRPLVWLFERSNAMAVHLAVLNRRDVVYLDKITQSAGTRLPSRIGGRFPATCTGLGKALLAFSEPRTLDDVLGTPFARSTPYSVCTRRQLLDQLIQTRASGFAVEREEACHGAICVAAPIIKGGVAIASISLSIASHEIATLAKSRLAAYGRLVTDAASSVNRLLPSA